MPLRSTHFAIAALLLIPVIMPMGAALEPSAALAGEMADAKPAASDSASLSKLSRKDIRKRMKALRERIKSGDLTGPERKRARGKIKAYRHELKARRAARGGERPPAAEGGNLPATKTAPQPPAAEQGNQPKTEGEEQAPAPEEANRPKTDTSTPPAANVSEADCNSLWSNANRNDDDVLTEEESKPFAEALKLAGSMPSAGDTGSGPTISKPEFLESCMKGAFRDMNP